MEFQSVTLEHRPLIERYTYKYGQNSCQHSFTAMVCLQNEYGDSVCEKDGMLFTLRAKYCTDDVRTYLFPLGDGDLSAAIRLVLDDAHAHGAKVRFETVTQRDAERLTALFPSEFELTEVRHMFEYVYERARIAQLSGHELATRRYEYVTFWRNMVGRAEISPITENDAEEILEFQKMWFSTQADNPEKEHLGYDNVSIETALYNFDALGLDGLALRIDDKMAGFVYGAKLSESCFDMLAEKGDKSVFGIYSVLNKEFATRCGKGCRWLNWEEDVAVPGLRQVKTSYKPDILMKKYIVNEVGK